MSNNILFLEIRILKHPTVVWYSVSDSIVEWYKSWCGGNDIKSWLVMLKSTWGEDKVPFSEFIKVLSTTQAQKSKIKMFTVENRTENYL